MRNSPPSGAMASSFTRFLDHTQRRTTVGRTPLDAWSARRRDLYLATHNNFNRQTSMLPVGFEPTISAGERPQTYALDRAATGTGNKNIKIHSTAVCGRSSPLHGIILLLRYLRFSFFLNSGLTKLNDPSSDPISVVKWCCDGLIIRREASYPVCVWHWALSCVSACTVSG